MRLWHIDLVSKLPRQQLLGQHRECCAMRGNGWGVSHSTVNYVWNHPYEMLYNYHVKVMLEMQERGYNVNEIWFSPAYRGQVLKWDYSSFTQINSFNFAPYPEHDKNYYLECINNLQNKNIVI